MTHGDAFFVALGDGRFRATERTSGPWDPRHQHAGPPSALLTGLLERTAPRISTVTRASTMSSRGAVRSSAPVSSAEGGPACWWRGSHGPLVRSVAR